jgi:hypothetical protein
VQVEVGLDSVMDPCQAALLVSYGTASTQHAMKIQFQNFHYSIGVWGIKRWKGRTKY